GTVGHQSVCLHQVVAIMVTDKLRRKMAPETGETFHGTTGTECAVVAVLADNMDIARAVNSRRGFDRLRHLAGPQRHTIRLVAAQQTVPATDQDVAIGVAHRLHEIPAVSEI